MQSETSLHIVVIGAGYSGIMATNRLLATDSAQQIKVTVVNPRPYFVERIRLHQLLAGTSQATVPFDELLHPQANLLVTEATHINASNSTVTLADNSVLNYDYLLYALGSCKATAEIPGVNEFSWNTAELESAMDLKERIYSLDRNKPNNIVIIGGGLTGVETAAELASLPSTTKITLITSDELCPGWSTQGKTKVRKYLQKLGVSVLESRTVSAVTATSVTLSQGPELPSDITIYSGGFSTPQLAKASGLTVDCIGRIRTDAALISVDAPNIIGIGDAVAPPGSVSKHIRMSCAAALPLGAQGAQTILALISGQSPQQISQGFAGQVLSLGRSYGAMQFVRSDDSPRSMAISGRPGAFIKEQICSLTLKWIKKEALKGGSYHWPKGPSENF
ncbi:MAG: NAD(P)/FAD-dependent oxidoreductase [Mycobacteriaceae bacterium]